MCEKNMNSMNSNKKAILDRIEHLEDVIAKGREYLETGVDANWHGFRPLFATKARTGKSLPPDKDWVRNVFLPRRERALKDAYEKLERLT
jgi:hypothetical protein